MLLERADMPAVDAVHHLVGLQAQLPSTPTSGGGALDELSAEGLRLVRFMRPEAADHDVHLVDGS